MPQEHVELAKKYRPALFKDVIGQPEAVRLLKEKLAAKKVPQAVLMQGGSGCGKTTLARILARKLGCGDLDLQEMNCAAVESPLDMVRDIKAQMGSRAMSGPCKVWILDELQSFARARFAQEALLKILEDTPQEVYFILCTTDPHKLLPAIRNRCMKVDVKTLSASDIGGLLRDVVAKEHLAIDDGVVGRIIEASGGCPREALQNLDKAAAFTDAESQLAAIASPEIERQAFDIVKALVWEKPSWKSLEAILVEVGEDVDVEKLRRAILTCAMNVLLGKSKGDKGRAGAILGAFECDLFASGRPGLVGRCWELMGSK